MYPPAFVKAVPSAVFLFLGLVLTVLRIVFGDFPATKALWGLNPYIPNSPKADENVYAGV